MKKYLIILAAVLCAVTSWSQTELDEVNRLISDSKYKEAEKIVNEFLANDPSNMVGNLLNARIMWRKGEHSEAFQLVNKTIASYPDSALPHLYRGNFYYTLNESQNCISECNKAIELFGDIADNDSSLLYTYSLRGSCYAHARKIDEAIQDHRHVLSLDSNHFASLNDLAMVLDDVDQDEEAIKLLYRVADLQPDFTEVYSNLGFVLMSGNRDEEALKIYDKALALDPKSPYILNNRGWCLHKNGLSDEGIKSIEKSLKLWKQNAYAYYYLGMIYESKGDMEKACENYYTAMQYQYTERYGPEAKDLYKKSCVTVK